MREGILIIIIKAFTLCIISYLNVCFNKKLKIFTNLFKNFVKIVEKYKILCYNKKVHNRLRLRGV